MEAKTVVWQQPGVEKNGKIDGLFGRLMEIKRVEFDTQETRVYVHFSYRTNRWQVLLPETHLLVDSTQYKVRSTEGLALGDTVYLTPKGEADVVYHFEPLPQTTRRFDFIGGEGKGSFRILGVESHAQRALRLFPSEWRNVETGEWEWGFFDDFVIHDCRYWNYVDRQQKGDTYHFTIESQGERHTLTLGKSKEGQRLFTVDGKKAKYDVISSITLPDYPTRDTVSAIKSNGYQRVDTITLRGWVKNMPKELKKKNKELSLSYTFLGSDTESASGAYDSLGRFEIKIPALNTIEAYIGWSSIYIKTPLEVGETYFLYYDWEEGHKLFMGKNARLLNEILSYPIRSVYGNFHIQKDRDKLTAEWVKEGVNHSYQEALEELADRETQHPTLSERYRNYLKLNYAANAANSMAQGFSIVGKDKVPSEYLKQLDELTPWDASPLTASRELQWICRNRLFDETFIKFYTKIGKKSYMNIDALIYLPMLKHQKQVNGLQITDEELSQIEHLGKAQKEALDKGNFENYKAFRDSLEHFNQQDWALKTLEILNREDVKRAYQLEMPLAKLYESMAVCQDQNFTPESRDLVCAYSLWSEMSRKRVILSDTLMDYVNQHINTQGCRDMIRQLSDKYKALRDRAKTNESQMGLHQLSDSLKGGTEGERLFRKLIEPYQGRLVLVDVWGTWCGPCKQTLSHSQEQYEKLKNYDIVYLYLCNNSTDKAWKSVIEEYNVKGPNVVHYNLPAAQQQSIENFLKVHSYPSYRLVDKTGQLVDVEIRINDLNSLDKLLQWVK